MNNAEKQDWITRVFCIFITRHKKHKNSLSTVTFIRKKPNIYIFPIGTVLDFFLFQII